MARERAARARAPPFIDPPGHTRHRPEATLLADEALPAKPLRQWVLSLPFAPRFLLATDAEASDRNKAASTVRMAAAFAGHRAAIIAAALPNLLKLLPSGRPNIHEPAYETLKIVSGRDYGERDYAAWRAWAAGQAAFSPAGR
jgi:hypothetical protein